MRSFLSATIILCASTSQLRASGQVWFSAVATGGNAIVLTQGSPGITPLLDCSTPGSSWAITVHYTLADGGATGWALDFYGNTGLQSITGLNVLSQGFPDVNTGSIPNAAGVLLQNQGGANLTPAGQGPGHFILEVFTLTASLCYGAIYAGIGSAEFGGNDPSQFGPFYETVQIGSNSPRAGYSNGGGDSLGAEPLPVLFIVGPEPSASAFALILIALFPRRRRNPPPVSSFHSLSPQP
jgi:hypothetical protein